MPERKSAPTHVPRHIPVATDRVILVDDQDRPLGSEDKLRAHAGIGGQLHRAFSIFVFDADGHFLLQRRAGTKYHFGGLWTNTCCSHPHEDYDMVEFARSRLYEEMGFDTELKEAFAFMYRATDIQSGLTEYEYDHVLFGRYDGMPRPNPVEVDDWRWADPAGLRADVTRYPERYTPWFRIVLDRVLSYREPEHWQLHGVAC